MADYAGNVGDPYRPYIPLIETFHVDVDGDAEAEVEGNVAAFFHDLLDDPVHTDDDDDTAYEGEYVFEVFKTCETSRVLRGRTVWYDRDDVSDFIWCLENRTNRTVHRRHFPDVATPSGQREDADEPEDEWDADDIRDAWLQNVGIGNDDG